MQQHKKVFSLTLAIFFIRRFLFNKKFKVTRGYLMLITSALMASFFALTFRQLSNQTSSLKAVILLYLFATLFSAPWFVWEKSWKVRISKRSWAFIIVICVSSLAGNYFNSIALQNINPSASQMIQRTDIFFGFAYGVIFFKNKINFSILLGIALCVLGLSFMYKEFFEAQLSLLAMSAGILTAFSFATMQFCTKMIVEEVSPNTINFWRIVMSLLFLAALSINVDFNLNLKIVLTAALAAFLGPFAIRLLINYAVKHTPFAAVSLVAAIAPVFTLGLQYVFFGITASVNELVGSTLVILALVTVSIFYRG